jgi:alpha/beta superfamily hydrolase
MGGGAVAWKLVTIRCADGLDLDALLVSPRRPIAVIVHIHGKGGNFYHNQFLREMYDVMPASRVAMLGVNTRGNGALVEAFKNGAITYVGSATERLADSCLDVAAAVEFAQRIATRIVVQGHSYGCDKVVYCALRGLLHEVVLISPADSAALQQRYGGSGPATGGLARVGWPDGDWCFAPRGQYGIRTNDKMYPIPMEAATLAAVLAGDDLRIFDQSRHPTATLANRALVLIGEGDDLQLGRAQGLAAYCRAFLPAGKIVVRPGADHYFSGHEAYLCSEILQWLNA